jgi:hypothetical protein
VKQEMYGTPRLTFYLQVDLLLSLFCVHDLAWWRVKASNLGRLSGRVVRFHLAHVSEADESILTMGLNLLCAPGHRGSNCRAPLPLVFTIHNCCCSWFAWFSALRSMKVVMNGTSRLIFYLQVAASFYCSAWMTVPGGESRLQTLSGRVVRFHLAKVSERNESIKIPFASIFDLSRQREFR